MFKKYLGDFLLYSFSFVLAFSIPIFFIAFLEIFPISVLIPIGAVYLFFVGYFIHLNVRKVLEHRLQLAENKENTWRKSLIERTSGFPSLLRYIQEFDEKIDNQLSNYLINKSHPALKSADIVREEAKRRRDAEFLLKRTQAIIEYYENIAPFLIEFKDQIIDENEDSLRVYTDEEREDPVTNYLTKDEYRKLSSLERNQMALERFWRRPKPKWLIGRLYERYVGYLYEARGYEVEYVGVFKGYEDLGRDLICKKDKEIIVIQCKNWSQFRTIFEKHIFQFFGTVFQYRDEYSKQDVKAMFYTSTEVSPLARRFAKELGIELVENFKLDQNYPCIKCNVSQVDGSKIYHLPFDQQYDNTKIESNKGEFYCLTVKKAEEKGFRRAFRWRGTKVDQLA